VRYASVFAFVAAPLLTLLVACSSEPAQPTPDGAPPPGEDAAPTLDGGVDATPIADAAADAPRPDCTRAGQAKTAPVTLYDQFLLDLANLSTAQARAARVDKLLADVAAQGGTPLEDAGDRLVFLVRGAGPLGPWSVAGEFTAWKTNARAMTQVPNTDLWVLDTTVSRSLGAQPYKLLSGTSDSGFREDLLAQNVRWDGIDRQTVGEFNAIAHPSGTPAQKGRLRAHRGVSATKLADTRDVFVYLPPRYDDGSCAPLPELVFHDGNESLTRGDFAGAADAFYQQTPAAQAVLVFVALPNQNVRMDQYTFGTQTAKAPLYKDFLVDDLAPSLAKQYRLCGNPGATGVSGASLGGLVSTWLAFERSDVWGYVGGQSSSFFWQNDAMITRAQNSTKLPIRFYLDHGCPNDNCASNRDMVAALKAKGYDVTHVEEPNGQHDWAYWKKRLPGVLGKFREGKTGCQ
jgi:enterochelin esterase family protein